MGLPDRRRRGWSNEELRACVQAYLELQILDLPDDEDFVRICARVVNERLIDRSIRAYDLRMRNISQVLGEMGYPTLTQYAAAPHVGNGITQRIQAIINDVYGPLFDPNPYGANFVRQVDEADELIRQGRIPDARNMQERPRPMLQLVERFHRDPFVVAHVLRRANGVCEACQESAPFLALGTRQPFLEVHHVLPLSANGPDACDNAAAVCPNCHRRLHYSDDRNEYRNWLIGQVDELRDYAEAQ